MEKEADPTNIEPEEVSAVEMSEGREENQEESPKLKLAEIFDVVRDGEMDEEKERRIIEAIEESSKEEFIKFMFEDLPENPNRHSLSKEMLEAYFDRGFAIYEELPDEERKSFFMSRMEYSIGLAGGFRRESPSDESITDKAFRAYQRVYSEHPESSDRFWETFLQVNGHTMRPDILIEGIAGMMARPDVSRYFKDHSSADINYLYTFNSKRYDQAIIDNLDFDNPDNFFKTAIFLEFVKKVHKEGKIWSYSEEGPINKLGEILKDVSNKEKGSYLLNLRARQLAEKIRKGDLSPDERDSIPFRLSEGTFGYESASGDFYTTEGDASSEMGELLQEYADIESEINAFLQNARNEAREQKRKKDEERGVDTKRKRLEEQARDISKTLPPGYGDVGEDDGDVLNVRTPPELIRRQREIGKDMGRLLTHKVDIEDLALRRQDKTEADKEKNAQDMYDYKYLMRKPTRENIEREFNFNLSDLSLKEQYYFLQFIKNMEASEVEPVKKFVETYGVDGLKTFLSTDYDKEIGSRIVEIGEGLEEADAKEIFSEYAQITDLADDFREMLEESDALKNSSLSEELRKELPANIYEALVRRSKDLLLSAHAIGVQKRDTELTIDDLKNSLRGLRTFLNIMKNLETQEQYEFTPRKSDNERLHRFHVENKEDGTEYGLKFFIRREEEENAQARINMELNFNTKNPDEILKETFAQTSDYGKGPKTSSVLRIAVDRDTYGGGENVSLDIGRSQYEGERFSRTGDKLGNLLQLASQSGHHTTESFDPKYAKKEAFKVVASLFEDYLEEKSAKLHLESHTA